MTKYHISPESGRPNICRAEKQDCPLKTDDGKPAPHFTDKGEAKAYAEGKLTEEHGETTSLKKKQPISNHKIQTVENPGIEVEGFPKFNAGSAEPKNFDEIYSEINGRRAEARMRRDRAYNYIQSTYNKREYNPKTRKTEYVEDGGKILAELRKKENPSASDQKLINDWEKAEREEVKNVILMTKLDRTYRDRGSWNRAYLVPDGHLHKSMDCSTCNKGETPTKFQFMTDYSGENEQQIVKAAGYRACTTCYPSAPVGDEKSLPSNMLTDDEKKRAEEQAQRKAELAAKKVDAANKAPTASGKPLTIKDGGYKQDLKTERAASQWYVAGVADGPPRDESEAQQDKDNRYKILYNIALKHDKPMKEIKEEFDNKAEIKSKRDYKSSLKHTEQLQKMNPNMGIEIRPYEEPKFDEYDVPEELFNKSPREWENANQYIPED